jgi:hypothetical protein
MPGEQKGRELVFRPNHVGEQVVLAAAMVSREFREAAARRHPADRFLVPEHQAAWRALLEAVRQGLEADPATLHRLSPQALNVQYLAELLQARPEAPDPKTLAFHEDALVWDHRRFTALTGPVSGLLEAINEAEPQDKVLALARRTLEAFEGGARSFILDPKLLIAGQMAEVRGRLSGVSHPFGLAGFDRREDGSLRMYSGCAPGQITVVTGTTGSGKSTFMANVVLAQARMKKRVLYGAWEVRPGITLELTARIALSDLYSRGEILVGPWERRDEEWVHTLPAAVQEERLQLLERTMGGIARYVQFMPNPFRRAGRWREMSRRGTRLDRNEANLDLVRGCIADSRCDVFVGDLWRRCLVDASPDAEEDALFEQQAMAEELGVHVFLVHQQRLKEIEQRIDKRPTREGAKGSSAYVEIADNFIGIHRDANWKNIPDTTMDALILKQREGPSPLAVQFPWMGGQGRLGAGKTIPYETSVVSVGQTTNPVDASGQIDRFTRSNGKRHR